MGTENERYKIEEEESESTEQQIQALIDSFSEEDRELLEKYIQLPNKPDIQPEVMQLITKYGERFSAVSDQVEQIRQKLGMDYNKLKNAILDKLGK